MIFGVEWQFSEFCLSLSNLVFFGFLLGGLFFLVSRSVRFLLFLCFFSELQALYPRFGLIAELHGNRRHLPPPVGWVTSVKECSLPFNLLVLLVIRKKPAIFIFGRVLCHAILSLDPLECITPPVGQLAFGHCLTTRFHLAALFSICFCCVGAKAFASHILVFLSSCFPLLPPPPGDPPQGVVPDLTTSQGGEFV